MGALCRDWSSSPIFYAGFKTTLIVLYGRTNFFYEPERFKSNHLAFESGHASFVEVQIRAADGSRREAKKNICGLAHVCIANFAHHNVASVFEHYRFH
jgi:hypothetical protein